MYPVSIRFWMYSDKKVARLGVIWYTSGQKQSKAPNKFEYRIRNDDSSSKRKSQRHRRFDWNTVTRTWSRGIWSRPKWKTNAWVNKMCWNFRVYKVLISSEFGNRTETSAIFPRKVLILISGFASRCKIDTAARHFCYQITLETDETCGPRLLKLIYKEARLSQYKTYIMPCFFHFFLQPSRWPITQSYSVATRKALKTARVLPDLRRVRQRKWILQRILTNLHLLRHVPVTARAAKEGL